MAEILVSRLAAPADMLSKVEIAGPGFINFFINDAFWYRVIPEIDQLGLAYGNSDLGAARGSRWSSSAPTPPGRCTSATGAARPLGDALAGCWPRPAIDGRAGVLHQRRRAQIRCDFPGPASTSCATASSWRAGDVPRELLPGRLHQGDGARAGRRAGRGAHLDAAEEWPAAGPWRAASPEPWRASSRTCRWTSASASTAASRSTTATDRGEVERAFEGLEERGYLYEHEGALWFRTTDFGDDKDRVVDRGDGGTTYFASDIAYHRNKFDRGFDRVVDIWGADHHGYVPRMKAAGARALGYDPDASRSSWCSWSTCCATASRSPCPPGAGSSRPCAT